MPVTIQWATPEKTIMIIEFLKVWDWAEFSEVYVKSQEMADSVNHKIDIIFDFILSERQGFLPPRSLGEFIKLAANPHPNRGNIVVVSPRMDMAKTMLNIIQKAGAIPQIHLVSTLEEAHAVLSPLSR